MESEKNSEVRKIGFNLPGDLIDRLHKAKETTGVPITRMVKDALTTYLDGKEIL